jgi:D-alanyl-D-alanine dipeptidase
MSNKLRNRIYTFSLFAFIFSTAISTAIYAQDKGYSIPPLTNKLEDYRKQVIQDSTKQMVELKKMIPSIVYDLRYATLNNFMRRLMYPAGTKETFMRLPASRALRNVQEDLKKKGYGLKIYDAYRPYAVTVKFWELVKDERYVANPSKGSGHNRGVAVDLTVIEMKTGKELNMGTGFDNFSDTAHHSFTLLPEHVLTNRRLLKEVMEKNGFRAYNEEWWHYSWPDASRYEILDLDFKKLKKGL